MGGNHGQIDKTGRTAYMVDALNCLYVVLWFGKKDIRYESLRISIIEWKPAGLNLHHYPVPRQKYVIHRRQDELVRQRRIGSDRLRRLETLPISAPKNIHGNVQLIATHLGPAGHFIWIYIEQFHHPVAVRTCCRRD